MNFCIPKDVGDNDCILWVNPHRYYLLHIIIVEASIIVLKTAIKPRMNNMAMTLVTSRISV